MHRIILLRHNDASRSYTTNTCNRNGMFVHRVQLVQCFLVAKETSRRLRRLLVCHIANSCTLLPQRGDVGTVCIVCAPAPLVAQLRISHSDKHECFVAAAPARTVQDGSKKNKSSPPPGDFLFWLFGPDPEQDILMFLRLHRQPEATKSWF